MRLYDVSQNVSKATFTFKAASLGCCFSNVERGFAGGLDKLVYSLDLSRGSQDVVGSHTEALSCIEWSYSQSILFTGFWDTSVCAWDPRSNYKIHQISTENKVYSLSVSENRLVVATAGRHVHIYDIRNMSQCEQKRESSLRHQSRKVSCFSNGAGYAMGFIEVI